jgi:opacity protein-like surface antigen
MYHHVGSPEPSHASRRASGSRTSICASWTVAAALGLAVLLRHNVTQLWPNKLGSIVKTTRRLLNPPPRVPSNKWWCFVVLRSLALAMGLTVLCASAAIAAPNHGWYASVELGADFSSADGRVTDLPLGGLLGLGGGSLPSPNEHVSNNFDTGWTGLAAVGVTLDAGFKIEAELGYRSADPSGDESVGQTSLMLNGLYSLPILSNVSLFAGAGLGVDHVTWDDLAPFGKGGSDQTVFAYQAIVGVTVDLTDRISLFAKYRYLDASGVDMQGLEVDWSDNAKIVIRGDDLTSQDASIGLQFAL